MSRWLKSVNSLLEKLDDRVENVVEERVLKAHQDEEMGIEDDAGLGDILAKRGLSSVDSNDDDDDDADEGQKEEAEEEPSPKVAMTDEVDETAAPSSVGNDTYTFSLQDDMKKNIAAVDDDSRGEVGGLEHGSRLESPGNSENAKELTHGEDTKEGKQSPPKGVDDRDSYSADQMGQYRNHEAPPSPTNLTPQPSTPVKTAPPRSVPEPESIGTPPRKTSSTSSRPPNPVTPKRTQRERELTAEMKEAQKEARTLRRHVVSLNEQLEAAESELQAQRDELERAAERMEKDRVRTKEEKEASQKRHAQEIALLKSQHETSLKEQQSRMEEQLEGYRKKLLEEESRRRQEGGDWDKEMSQAIEREQSMRQQVSALEDEKVVLLSQISTLQSQQMALGSRLESLTQAADNAMDRERDAEDRLDAALNQHARQISQRQARESELERTIQELNAALVASKNRRSNGRLSGSSAGDVADTDNIATNRYIDSRISALEMDLDCANSQLALEKERSQTLQMQLRDLSKATTQEATMVHAKQIQYDRQIADMSLTISKLEASLREAARVGPSDSNTTEPFGISDEKADQIKLLSEEVVRLRDNIANLNSESLAMKHRLRAATERANKAEEELTIVKSSSASDPDFYDGMERANMPSGSRRRKTGTPPSGSIRSAMRLESRNGERSEQIGQVVDAVDSFAVSTGKYLRKNPMARAGFIFYLILIHLWTFALLFFHAHTFETEHGDFGAGIGVSHGPHALMMKQNQAYIVEPVGATPNADTGAAIPNADSDQAAISGDAGGAVDNVGTPHGKENARNEPEVPNE